MQFSPPPACPTRRVRAERCSNTRWPGPVCVSYLTRGEEREVFTGAAAGHSAPIRVVVCVSIHEWSWFGEEIVAVQSVGVGLGSRGARARKKLLAARVWAARSPCVSRAG